MNGPRRHKPTETHLAEDDIKESKWTDSGKEYSEKYENKKYTQTPKVDNAVKDAIWAGKDVMQCIPRMLTTAETYYGDFGEKEFRNRFRSLELAVINGTDRCLHFKGEFFREGTWFVSPQPLVIEPGTGSIAFVATKQRAIYTGVGGGLEYKLDGTDFSLYMGFTNPIVGCYKTFVEVAAWRSAKWAYENSKDDTVNRQRNHGYFSTCTLRPSRHSPFRKVEYTVMQV